MLTDIGWLIGHFVFSLVYDHLVEDIYEVLNILVPKVLEVQVKDGAWYLIYIKLYRILENVIDGAVIIFVDITEQKQGDDLRWLGMVIRDLNDAVIVQDFHGKILSWNRGAYLVYGWTEAEVLSMNSLEMIPENKRAEILAIYQQLSVGEIICFFEIQWLTRDGRILEVWLTLTVLVNKADQLVVIATTERDIIERKQVGQILVFENRAIKVAN